MTAEGTHVKKELIQYLLSKVKERELDPYVVKKYIAELALPTKIEHEPIAIIGMSCRFPDAETPDQLWDNICEGRESISTFPEKRLQDFQRIRAVSGPLRRGGFLKSIDAFDAEYFNIPPRVALHMDPYHRQLLHIFVEAMEDAGYHRGQLQGRNVGIYVGNDHTHRLSISYLPFVSDHDFTTITGSWTGVLASRLSYLLNLQGPAVVLDTGCSSALVALDYAIKAIHQGDCDSALVGSSNLFLDPVDFYNETQSTEYVVRAFDSKAGGTVWSEGIGAIYIKPLSKALADKDHIYGVIKGIATNNDGKSNGLTAPSAKAQRDVLIKAWERAEISPESISYIETHGTGTNLGDTIEIKGLTEAFSKYTSKRQFCAIGSIKSNIGHTVGSAGMASLLKVLLSFREQVLPPSINFEIPNLNIDFCKSPVFVQSQLTPWETDSLPRRAGISSFSLSGTNCHMIVEEPPADNRSREDNRLSIYPLSGRTPELLKQNAERHLAYVKRNPHIRWDDLCFTASTGREHQAVRAAILCKRPEELAKALEALIDTFTLPATSRKADISFPQGSEFRLWLSSTVAGEQASERQEHISESAVRSLFTQLADPGSDIQNDRMQEWAQLALHYVNGADVDFASIYASRAVRRVPLPSQVWNARRFWDETVQLAQDGEASSTGSVQETTFDAVSLWSQASTTALRFPAGYEPSTQVEVLLGWIWSEVLGYPIIQPMDDFYALGGDSVNALKIIQVLNAAFDVELPPSALLGSPIFADFASIVIEQCGFTDAVLHKKLHLNDADVKSQLAETEQEDALPLSPAQTRMFLSAGMMPDSIAYNVTGVVRLRQQESIANVEQVMRLLIERHDGLRASFHLDNNDPVQVVHPQVEFSVERKRLASAHDDKLRLNILQTELEQFIRPFDLSKAPLMRAGYFEFEDGEAYLAIDLHHIITDGTSMGILFTEYNALTEGKSLPPLPIRYRDAIVKMRERQAGVVMQKQRTWWVEQFADGIPVLELYTDKSRPPVRDYRGSRFMHTLPKALTEHVKEVAKQCGTTLFALLLASVHNLLARMGAGRDIVIGTPVAGRPQLDLQGIVGMFVNTLPIRTQSRHEESFRDFLSRVKGTVLSAFDNQEYPYESLIDELQPERNPGRNPLFDIYFALQNVEMGIADPQEDFIPFDHRTAKFDLTVVARETPEGLLVEWEYAESLYDRESIERMALRFQTQLESIASNPNSTLSSLELMGEQEQALLLKEWNQTCTPAPLDHSLASLFEEIVHIYGDNDAVIMDNQRMSYRELNARANQIAQQIMNLGIKPSSGIALLFHRSFDMIAAIVAVLKSGCFYIPMDPDNAAARLTFMMNDGQAKLLLTHEGLEQRLEGSLDGVPVLDVERLEPTAVAESPGLHMTGDDAAYVIYTSGSTGTPKGTLIRQKSVTRVVRKAGYIDIAPDDVLLQLSNYSFDGSVFDIFGALLNGASLVIMHKEEVTDPHKLGQIIADNDVSIFFITTALFNALIDANLDCLVHVRKILFGGELASANHIRRAYERLGPDKIIHVYGPTETTVFATAYPLQKCPEEDSIPIGQAIGNTSLYVLDDHMQLQPIGVPGELFIGGPGLAQAYMNQPELTSDRFVNHPFRQHERLYRSGDLVIWLEDGNIKYLGRRDQQVKLRGYRIELGEIEAAAYHVSIVRESHANVHIDDRGARNLCMWVVLEDGAGELGCDAIRQSLAKDLPSYMVPTFIIPVAALPLNKNGKIDKAKLPSPFIAIRQQRGSREPRSAEEQALSDVWSQVLGADAPRIDDNFFALGGDSIKAIQVIARLQNMGFTLKMEDLLRYQTIEAAAVHLSAARITAEQNQVSGHCLPSAIQSWYLGTPAALQLRFNQAMLLRVGRIDSAHLSTALRRVIEHHDALRLAVTEDGSMRIRTSDEGNMYYLTTLPDHADEQELNQALVEIQEHLHLNGGPLLAAAIGRANEGDQLFIAIHHMAVDVVSWGFILEDLMACMSDPAALLPRKTTSLPAWTMKLHEWSAAGGSRDELPYWRALAEEVRTMQLPAPVRARHQDTTRVEYEIDGEVGKALTGSSNQAYHTETVHLLLSVLTFALCSWLDRASLLINFEGHGREEVADELDVSRTAGWFTSTYPMILQAQGEMGAAIKGIKETVRSVPRKGFGFGVLRTLDIGLSTEDQALLDSLRPFISFNYLGIQNQVSDEVSWRSLPGEITVDEAWETPWLLDIVAAQIGSSLTLELRYPNNRFEADEITNLLSMIQSVAEDVAQHCMAMDIGEKTASDYTVTKLEQDELESILEDLLTP